MPVGINIPHHLELPSSAGKQVLVGTLVRIVEDVESGEWSMRGSDWKDFLSSPPLTPARLH